MYNVTEHQWNVIKSVLSEHKTTSHIISEVESQVIVEAPEGVKSKDVIMFKKGDRIVVVNGDKVDVLQQGKKGTVIGRGYIYGECGVEVDWDDFGFNYDIRKKDIKLI